MTRVNPARRHLRPAWLLLIALLAGCGVATTSHAVSTSTPTLGAASIPGAATPAPLPTEKGNFSGSCDINLNYPGTNVLTATVQVQNTGNVGTIDKVTVKWPVQGYAPITESKTVKVRAGASKSVEMHQPASEAVTNGFQDEQLASSDLSTGAPCKYHGTIEGTFGKVQG